MNDTKNTMNDTKITMNDTKNAMTEHTKILYMPPFLKIRTNWDFRHFDHKNILNRVCECVCEYTLCVLFTYICICKQIHK